MIAHEHIQKIRLKELACIFLISMAAAMLIFLSNLIFSPSIFFIASIAILVLGMNFSVYLIRKTGVATIFYLITAILTISLFDIGVTGWKKIFVFFSAGILFELVFLILKLEIHNLPMDIIIGTSVSTAGLPFISALLLSVSLASSFPIALINLIILAFAVGLVASVIAFIIWYHIEPTKVMLKLHYYLMS